MKKKPSPARQARKPVSAVQEKLPAPKVADSFPIIGIGASAGGLEALEQFISHVPKASGMAYVIVQHLDPTRKGLMPALQMHMKQFMADTGIRVSLNAFTKIDQLTITVRTMLYRIIQESLTNVARHSGASLVVVRIEVVADVIRLTVKDNGVGFQVTGKVRSGKKSRLGLVGMKERAEMMGGSFRVDSASGGPTTVQVEIPTT